jgi:hypothetical protein
MAARLSALRAGRTLPPGFFFFFNIPGTHFCWRLSRPQQFISDTIIYLVNHLIAGMISLVQFVISLVIQLIGWLFVCCLVNYLIVLFMQFHMSVNLDHIPPARLARLKPGIHI